MGEHYQDLALFNLGKRLYPPNFLSYKVLKCTVVNWAFPLKGEFVEVTTILPFNIMLISALWSWP